MRCLPLIVLLLTTTAAPLASAQTWPCPRTEPFWVVSSGMTPNGALLVEGPCPSPCTNIAPPLGFRVRDGDQEVQGQVIEQGGTNGGSGYGPERGWFAWKPQVMPEVGDTLTVWFDDQTYWVVGVGSDEERKATISSRSLEMATVPFGEPVCCQGDADSCGKAPCFSQQELRRDMLSVFIDWRASHLYRAVWTSPGNETVTDEFSFPNWQFHVFENPSSQYCYRIEERPVPSGATTIVAQDCLTTPAARDYSPIPNESTRDYVLLACPAPPPGYEQDFCDLYEGRCATEPELPGCSFATRMCSYAPPAPDAGVPVSDAGEIEPGETADASVPITPAAKASSDGGCSVAARSGTATPTLWLWLLTVCVFSRITRTRQSPGCPRWR